jgi:hypothetical protein
MDAQEHIAWNAKLAVAVLVGRNEDGQATLNLVNLDETMPPEARAILAGQGCRYMGVLGFFEGGLCACEPADYTPATLLTLRDAVAPFLAYAEEKLARLAPNTPKGDGEEWLRMLWNLPDTRTSRD